MTSSTRQKSDSSSTGKNVDSNEKLKTLRENPDLIRKTVCTKMLPHTTLQASPSAVSALVEAYLYSAGVKTRSGITEVVLKPLYLHLGDHRK